MQCISLDPQNPRAPGPRPSTSQPPRAHTGQSLCEMPRQRRRREKHSRSTSPAGRKAHSRHRRPSAEHQGGHPSLTSVTAKAPPFFPRSRPRDADNSHHRRRGAKRRRVLHTDSSLRCSNSSSSSSSDFSSLRDRRRHHHRRLRSSSLESFSDSPFISSSATPAKYLIKRIRRGKFVGFDKLLLPVARCGSGCKTYSGFSPREEARGRPRDLVRGMEHFLCRTPAGIPVIRSAAGQVPDNHVPVVFVLSSRGLYKIWLPIPAGSGTGQIPPYTLGPSEGQHPSVVRDPAPLSSPQAAICQRSAYLCRHRHKQGYPRAHHPHTVRSGNLPKILLFLLYSG